MKNIHIYKKICILLNCIVSIILGVRWCDLRIIKTGQVATRSEGFRKQLNLLKNFVSVVNLNPCQNSFVVVRFSELNRGLADGRTGEVDLLKSRNEAINPFLIHLH